MRFSGLVDSRYNVLPECARQAAFGCPDLDQCPQHCLYLRPDLQGHGAFLGAAGLGVSGVGAVGSGSGLASGLFFRNSSSWRLSSS